MDIIERAEAALEGRWPGERLVSPARFFGGIIRELIAELKAARAERDRLQRNIRYLQLSIYEEVGRLSYAETDELEELSKEFL